MPRTTVELIDELSQGIEALAEELLLQHSEIREVPPPRPGDTFVLVGFKKSWEKLDLQGRQLQSRLLRELGRYEPLVEVLTRSAPSGARKEIREASATVRELLEQSSGTSDATPEAALDKVRAALAEHREQLASLYDPAPGEAVYVPDANAVIWNLNLEEWEFQTTPKFSIVLTSTLLSELDDLKMPHRGASVRKKAEGAIRRFKEYSRRGDIHEGVTLRRDRSTVRVTAVEPDFEATLPWLDRAVQDDRLLAAVLEIVREHPHSPVILVTRDVNMQNKARHAGIPFVEPPDPPRSAQRRRPPTADVRVLEITPTGGSEGKVDFSALVQNYGTKPVRVALAARVGDMAVSCRPTTLDLLANVEPSSVMIDVPRPTLGDVVKELNDTTTLYLRELTLEVTVDGEPATAETWREEQYDPAIDATRARIQRAIWWSARGRQWREVNPRA